MSQRKEMLILLITLLVTGGIIGGGVWWWFSLQRSAERPSPPSPGPVSSPPATVPLNRFAMPGTMAQGTVLRLHGSTSMVGINMALKQRWEQTFPGTQLQLLANGSSEGIRDLLAGQADVAAISRPLTPEEQAQKLQMVTIAQDRIALVVGNQNPFRTGLTQAQVRGIFLGQILQWRDLGTEGGAIRVINRPAISGTYQTFQELVLGGADFGAHPNGVNLPRDATTPMLQALGQDGIGYATYSQVARQQTVRVVPVDGLTPEAQDYPYQRPLFYVYREPPSPQVQGFLGFVGSPLGQAAIVQGESPETR